MVPERSLIQVIREGGFETSLVTTFSVYLPFYEEVVLRRLRGSGCRHNLVLVDAAQCSESLAHSETRPRYAGRDYTLVPIHSNGAFHPKIVILIGRAKAAVYVGSHNLTISGFGYNRELTNLVEFSPKKDDLGTKFARDVWQAARSWVRSQEGRLPDVVEEAVLAAKNFAPWLEGPLLDSSELSFLAQSSASPSLWRQLYSAIPATVKRVVVLGAFFDQKLRFLEELHKSWPSAKITLGIEPKTVAIPTNASTTPWLDVRDASAIYKNSGYLHAKALFFDTGGNDDVLVTGSANPSAAAWLANTSNRNEEAVVVRRGKLALAAARDLGLASVPSMPKVSRESWATIAATKPRALERSTEYAGAVLASVNEDGFAIPSAALANGKVRSVVARDAHGVALGTLLDVRAQGSTQIVIASPEITQPTTELIVQIVGGRTVRALVHHTSEIRELTRSTKQVQLRAALEGMGDATADLAKLIATVERVIFDEHEVQAEAHPVADPRKRKAADAASPAKPESLSVDLKDTKQARKHRRLLASGNLAYLLDVLIRRLGIGLERTAPEVDAKGRSEEEQPDQDDEEEAPTRQIKELDVNAVARLVRNKGKNLVRRMVAQMEKAASEKSTDPAVLLQLVAVIALLREIRLIERLPKWRVAHEQLVSKDSEEELLFGTLTYLFGRRYQLYQAILDSLGDERFDELARLKGLLIWLSWDCDVAIDERYGYSEEPDDVERRVEDKAVLLELAQILLGDGLAREEATNSVLQGTSGGQQQVAARWLATYFQFAGEVERYLLSLGTAEGLRRTVHLGDLAYIPAAQPRRLRVVSELADSNVALVDFSENDSKIRYESNKVVSAEMD